MTALQAISFLFAAAGGTAVVFTREPRRQVLVLSLYGLVLTILFMTLQAPDVAFSELAVGSVAVPAMLLIALAATSRRRDSEQVAKDEKAPPPTDHPE
ncbi:MAG: hypothetical protein B7Z80_19485 [Rhodospirillales bacterium 20-64-7]|nr:MAG: hypothetical protein B7Z80_19485 [Rhodospirillales bacterium 20-64-7]